ncbi:hypothetical protein B0H11DRAFT_2227555 [Mycena galericulata]|nr:hypothetical protein B0H11DRAFT_2227555 [Mycena galericulata]
MADILGELNFPADVCLGPPVDTHEGQVLHYYVDAHTLERINVLVIGVVSEVLDVGEDISQIAVLVAPDSQASHGIRLMFDDCCKVLDNVLVHERLDTSRIIFSRQHWSQGVGEHTESAFFIRMSPQTMRTRTDFSREADTFPYERVAHEIPFASDDAPQLEKGALLACCVQMFRVDHPLLEKGECSVYSRAYVLDTVSCSRFLRSTGEMPVDRMQGEDAF